MMFARFPTTAGGSRTCSSSAAAPCAARTIRNVVPRAASHITAPVDVPEGHLPERKFLNDLPDNIWRYGKPDYSVVNREYLINKKSNWQPGSLPDIVESVVKTFEMEISHKVTPDLVQSFAPNFRYSQNGNEKIDGTELLRRGSYNVLINDASYVANNFDFDESHIQFKSAFPGGFAWEVTEVLAGPPNVTFRWRHWGHFTGEYAGFKHTNETIEVYGMAVARVNDKLQIEDLEIFYDPTEFLTNLTKGGKINPDAAAVANAASTCPFLQAAPFLRPMFGAAKPH